jgi:hypothetical protein
MRKEILMQNNALYYPHISLMDDNWIKAMSIFYENIYRIVPDGIIPDDNPNLQPLLEEGSIGRMINPSRYARDASEVFLSKVDSEWNAAALYPSDEDFDISRLHTDKIDVVVRELFTELGFTEHNGWIDLPIELASNYMLFLAQDIASKNNLALITQDWGPFTATNYFSLDGGIDLAPYEEGRDYSEHPFALFSLIISGIAPLNIQEIPSEKIIAFRQQRRGEIANFRNTVYDLYAELQLVEDPEIKFDIIQTKISDLERAKKDYQNSADVIKAKGWFGNSIMGFPAPFAFSKIFGIPTLSAAIIGATGVALGGLFNLRKTKEELQKLRRDNPVSSLVDMKKSFSKYTADHSAGDINRHAWNCMEEYIND